MSEQYKTQQLLSIVLIGIVGARYGQEVEQTKQSNTPIKGFTVESPEMILKLSKIMMNTGCTKSFATFFILHLSQLPKMIKSWFFC